MDAEGGEHRVHAARHGHLRQAREGQRRGRTAHSGGEAEERVDRRGDRVGGRRGHPHVDRQHAGVEARGGGIAHERAVVNDAHLELRLHAQQIGGARQRRGQQRARRSAVAAPELIRRRRVLDREVEHGVAGTHEVGSGRPDRQRRYQDACGTRRAGRRIPGGLPQLDPSRDGGIQRVVEEAVHAYHVLRRQAARHEIHERRLRHSRAVAEPKRIALRKEEPVPGSAEVLRRADRVADARGSAVRHPEFRRADREEHALADGGEVGRGRGEGRGVHLHRHALHHAEQVERAAAAAHKIGRPTDIGQAGEVRPDTRACGILGLQRHRAAGEPQPVTGREVERAVHVRQIRRRGQVDAGIILHFDRGGRGGRVIDADVVGAGHHVPQVNDPLPRREAPAFRREDIRQHTGLRRQLERQRAVRAGLIREGADRERLGRRGLDAQRHAGPAVAQEMPHRVGEVHLGYDPLGGVSEERAARRVGEGHHAVALEVEHLHREGREHAAAEVGQPFGAPDHGGAERITAIQLLGPAGQEEELVTDGAELRRVADRRRRVIHLERVHRRRVRDVQDAGAVTHARRVEQAILDGRQVVQRLEVLRAFHERRAGRVEELERRRPTRRHVRHEEERPTHIHRLHYRRARAGQREIRVRRAERAGRSATAPLPQIHTGCGARREEDIRTGGGEVRKAGRAPHRCAEHGLAATAGHLEEIDAQVED